MNRTRCAGATSRMRGAGMGALMGTVLLSAGCGGSHSTAVSLAASTILTSDANGVAAAADTGSTDSLSAAAAKMRSDVLALEATGGLSNSRAAAVLAQVQRVVADAALVPIASSRVPTVGDSLSPVAPTAVPNTAAPGSGHGRKNGGPPPGHSKSHS
jgi:hypothetical protein